jgi:predicted membrane-bound spermidine synthase
MKAVIGLLAGVAVVLLAQFPLEPLADQSDLVHWVQHGLIFWAGIAVGVSLTLLYRLGRRKAAWPER